MPFSIGPPAKRVRLKNTSAATVGPGSRLLTGRAAPALPLHYMQALALSTVHRGWPPHPPPWVAAPACGLDGDSAPSLAPLLPALDAPTRVSAQEEPPPSSLVHIRRPNGFRHGADMQAHRERRRDGAVDNAARDLAGVPNAGADSLNQVRLKRILDADE